MEDTSNDPQKWLKDHCELLQKTRTLWHSGMDTASDECLQLKKHVQELNMSCSILSKYPFPVNMDYQQKAGIVLASSGSLVILCDIAVKLFGLARESSTAVDIENGFVFLKDILRFLASCTDHDAVVCKAVQDHQGLVPVLLTRLQGWHREHLADTLQKKLDYIIHSAMTIVHNMASFEENVQYLRELPNALCVLQSYTTGTTECNRCTALTTMAELVTEKEVHMLATDTQMVRFILEQLEQALKTEDAYSLNGWEVTEVIRAIAILAKNEDNKKRLVKEGVLPCLERVLNCTNYDRKDCKRCQESTRAMLCLMTVEQHKDELVKNERLLDSVVKIYSDKAKTHSKECFDTAQKVIASLLGKLEAHPKYKRIAFQIRRGQTCEVYTMSSRPRGHCVIINNRDFSNAADTRLGTDVDKDKLADLFSGMKFNVTIHNNLTGEDMINQIKAVANMNHKTYDLFVCCILSHGTAGCVSGVDYASVKMRDLMAPFQANKCLDLADKPKLFFIQACQGDGSQAVIDEQHNKTGTDAIGDAVRYGSIPNEADFLLGYCTVPGNVAYRNPKEGSPYISALCDYLDNNYENLDILDILTMVTDHVSRNQIVDQNAVTVLQLPTPISTLRKKLFFGKS